ncbi:pullulanase-type alpha-1,6-glucosidase [Agarivorans sp. Alg241-V36]|uniref:pullulanase-type alpha-1,6-glucosidase n=1 Tax=Agarivorans sp. Alg241-V36 TaxID=2305992 RepID=UPI0013D13F03|nr:pullulanase-type alpha-1,6-glucosidase [Agarivorans sp. Alg241-V36]
MDIKISKLAKLTMPFVVAVAITACGSSKTEIVPEVQEPSVSTPEVVETDPIIVLPGDAPTPSAEQFAFSYVAEAANGSSAQVAFSARATEFNAWVLQCADSSYSPEGNDDFGPSWLINVSELETCTDFKVLDENQEEKGSFTASAGLAGKNVGISEGSSDLIEGSRTDLLLAGQGLPQAGTDVVLPEVEAPGDHEVASSGQIALQIYDPMGDFADDYAAMNLHLWKDNCDNSPLNDSALNNGWDDVSVTPDTSDRFGPVWYLPIDADEGCFNVIFRTNENKDKLIGDDIRIDVATMGENRSITLMPSNATQFASRDTAFEEAGPSAGFEVSTVGAIMLDDDTIAWRGGDGASMVQLMFTHDGEFSVTDGVVSGPSIVLSGGTLSDEQKSKFPHLADYPAFTLPSLPESISLTDILKGSVVAIASNDVGEMRSVTGVQYAGALDALYAESAKELDYGAVVSGEETTFRIWAPTATNVEVVIYNDDKTIRDRLPMVEDAASGSWSVNAPNADVDRRFYRYALTVFNPTQQKVYGYEVTDPYSLSLSMNSLYSQVVDLDADDLKPAGWDSVTAPHSQLGSDLSDMVIYESHVRDFSSLDASTANKGKYLAFTEEGTVPTEHLKELQDAGLTHLHLMPVFDLATINEDPTKVANIDEPFSKLCSVNRSVAESEDFVSYCRSEQTLAEVFEELAEEDSIDSPKVQALNEYVRGVDSYNWGYDPFHFNVPEGSYATDAEGTARILEFREMVKAVKENLGLNVVVDVVYNHTNASGLNDKSVLDKVVPMYYQRLVPDTGMVETSTCCDNTAPEHAMYAKFIDDSLIVWTEQYKIDAYRWDLMGHHPLEQMQTTLAAAQSVNEEVYFYGEGWNFGEVQDDRRFVQATQKHLGGTGIGSFSDRLRDAVRGGSPFDSADGIRATQGFGNGAYVLPNELVSLTGEANEDGKTPGEIELARALHQADLTRLGMAGNLSDFQMLTKDDLVMSGSTIDYNGQAAGYAQEPWEIQNYVSKHDNQTLWDINMYKVSHDASVEDRVRMQGVSLSTVLLGQAMPFTHMGVELLRSKSMQRDSYDYGDWYNKVDFTLADNNWDKGLPAAEKDEANFETIEGVLTDKAQPAAIDMMNSVDVYKELLRLRKASPLMTLPSGQEIIDRVDFRNVGPAQTPGLIVMTIDNGLGHNADLDADLDGIVVIVNATPESQMVSGFVDGDGNPIALANFELSEAHSAANSIAGDAAFADGKFTVPAWSSAVFNMARDGERGTGLPQGQKGDTPPLGLAQVYIAGDMNGWDAAGTEATYAGNGLYTVETAVMAGQEYKFTLGNWDTSWGCGGGNCTVTESGFYTLTLDANDSANPEVSMETLDEAFADIAMHVPGSIIDWKHDATTQMTYVDGAIYSFTFAADSAVQFKVTGSGWGIHEHGFDAVVVADDSLALTNNGGNIEFTPAAAGNFVLTFDLVSKQLAVKAE